MARRFLFFFMVCIASTNSLSNFAAESAPSVPLMPKVPPGFSIELAAAPPLIERPIVAAFDDEGRLFVAESSGSNAPVKQQLEEKPHRIVCLEDTDGDGKFDKRTVFADHMMFPEGALFFDGSLYVSAPPSIWKLTDTDGDGVADKREEWFKGGTLTGCANDLHGPYAGPDGYIYWCKGAFAEQTHKVNGKEWKSKASHIFRCRPDGTGLEPVITAGMDNPVDVAFMPDGEMILSGTYFNGNPRHDGLAHAVYGGVYGKEHNVLDGHPRTGELMPLLVTMSASAACGLERYDSDVFGPEYRDNLFLCQFNMRKVSRHVLKPSGSTYTSTDSDFVWSDFVDFHPTDLVVDADGSLLVVDTGGWYKICCPSSQLWKPDVLGGIYRVRKIGAKPPADPRGQKIAWTKQSPAKIWEMFSDKRFAVRQRAIRELARRASSKQVEDLLVHRETEFVTSSSAKSRLDSQSMARQIDVVLALAWTCAQLNTPAASRWRALMLVSPVPEVRHVGLEAMSLHRDPNAFGLLLQRLDYDTPANRRVAAEALGRIRNPAAVPRLLVAASQSDDRISQHSVIYALIEIADAAATRRGLLAKPPKTIAAAMIALDQMSGGDLKASDVVPHLASSNETLRDAATWIVRHHSEWGGELAEWFRGQIKSVKAMPKSATAESPNATLEDLLVLFSTDPSTQQLLAEAITEPESSAAQHAVALRVMAHSKVQGLPPDSWKAAIAKSIKEGKPDELPLAMAATRRFPIASATDSKLSQSLAAIADNAKQPSALRVDALSIIAGKRPQLTASQFQLLEQSLSADSPVAVRSAAADAVAKSHLMPQQLERLCTIIQSAGPLELNRLFKPFEASHDDALGLKLIVSLKKSSSLASLRLDLLRDALAKYGLDVQKGISELESLVNVDAAAQRRHIEEMLPLLSNGDIRRGHAVFYSSKAACASCHRLGHAGGTTGPDLTHVGKTRTERDILESVLYPSLSFVRSYEPVLVTTTDGKTINGVIREDNAKEYVLAIGPDQEARVPKDEVDQLQPSTVSIMPAGLDKQLSKQELADLVAFLKNRPGQ
jgi:putative membrane-bound dehydrogenase-like protein